MAHTLNAAGPRSRKLFLQATQLFPGGVNSPVRAFGAVGGQPLFHARGQGAHLWDTDGRRFIDYVGSWGPLILGHNHPQVRRAATAALRHGATFGAPHEGELRLGALVQEAYPALERLRFVSSGTEAVMSALRLARGVTGRSEIVKCAGGYHGHTDSLLVSAGSGALTFGRPNSSGVPKAWARLTHVLPYNDGAAWRRLFARRGRKLAAVIVEPVAGNMGTVPPAPHFLAELRRLTRASGTLLIFDEVMTGFRLAWGGAEAWSQVRPDLTCLGKIVGGGFPVAAFGGSLALMKHLAPLGSVYQAGTLSGHPVGMAAGAATLDRLRQDKPYAKLNRLSVELAEGLRRAARLAGRDVQVNQVGSMFTVFFTKHPVTDLASAQTSDTQAYARFFHGLLRRGVYFPPAQFEAAFVSTAHTSKDVHLTLKAAAAAFAEGLEK